MRILWYVAQTLFIGWFAYAYWARYPNSTTLELMLMIGMWIALCAFLTACLTRLWDWIVRRLRALKRHGAEASGDSLRLTGAGRGAGKPAEHVKRLRVGE